MSKLGQEPAFGFGYIERVFINFDHSYENIPRFTKGISKRLHIATEITKALISNYSEIRKVNDGYIANTEYSEIVKEAYNITDEILKQENL